MNNTINTVLTDKGYKINLVYNTDQSIFENYDFFGEGMHFRFLGKDMEYATSKEFRNTSEDVIDMIFGNYEFSEDDPCGYEEYNKQKAEEIKEKYWIYPISTYEHGNFAFHLGNSNNLRGKDGLILLDKNLYSERTEKEVENFLINDFSDFFNGRMYEIEIEKPHEYEDKEGNTVTLWDYIDGNGPIFSREIEEIYKAEYEDQYGKLEKSLLNY